jgi:glycine hydroxymethyltransferase
MNSKLSDDNELQTIINNENKRQKENIELIASENFTSLGVMECLGSILTNKYSEGRPNKRYYGGNEYIDELELLCEKRALSLFNLSSDTWGVNVQPYSGSVANIAVYNGILKPGDKILGLNLYSGGHLSHGFQTPTKKINISSVIYQSISYNIKEDGYIDYEELEIIALKEQPSLIICGGSAYPRDIDYLRFRNICDMINILLKNENKKCYLMADIAHINGFVFTGIMNNPFQYCDIVTTTTHKTMRGPRSGMIFAKKDNNLFNNICESVFPGVQGGPHNNQIAALAFQLKEANTPQFKNYMKNVIKNSHFFANELKERGFKLSTDGTDNHILLIDLKNFEISGSKMERVCELVNISLNKNTVYGDTSALSPSGIRLGTTCMTTRQMPEEGWRKLSNWLLKCVNICRDRQVKYGKKLVDFNKDIENDTDIIKIKKEIIDYANTLPFYD